MISAIHGAANLGNTASNPAGGLIVHDQDCFDAVALVRREACFHIFGIDSTSPVSRHKLDVEAHLFGEILPQSRKLSSLGCEDVVAGRKRIYNCSLPSSGT